MDNKAVKPMRKGRTCRYLFLAVLLLSGVLCTTGSAADAPPAIDIRLNGQPGSIPWNFGDLIPGLQNDTYVDVTNNGTMDCALYIWVSNITGDYDLGKYMYFKVSGPRLSTNVKLPATIYEFPRRPDDAIFIEISPIQAGETVRLHWTWRFRETYTPQNEAQGKKLGFEAMYTLQCPPPCLLPVADFTANPTGGTLPLTVRFTDRSTGNPTSWLWNFGDGTTSTLQNPVHVYRNPGTYTVTQIASNSCGSSDPAIKFDFISVTKCPPPAPEFTANITSGTAPLNVQFTDRSSGEPNRWNWDFGDGKTSTEQNPFHTYCCPGCYNVTLEVSNTCGYNQTRKENYICVQPGPPDPDFWANTTSGRAPLSVHFYDLSPGSPSYWLWDFGDGTTSTDQNPLHIYRNPSCYSVRLTVTNSFGSGTELKINYICVQPGLPPTADFKASSICGPVPLTVQFSDLSTGDPSSWLWDFGDGTGANDQNPLHTYNEPGCYWVNLSVSNSFGSDIEQKKKYICACYPDVCARPGTPVAAPTAEFQVNSTFGTAPLSLQFSDRSIGGSTSWLWDFGDKTASGDMNPVHRYENPGIYTVSLTVSNKFGRDTLVKQDYIIVSAEPALIADFSAQPLTGYSPLLVRFTDLSTKNPTAWLWNFGDAKTSTERNPSHRYDYPGFYFVSLQVWNSLGSANETKEGYISVFSSGSGELGGGGASSGGGGLGGGGGSSGGYGGFFVPPESATNAVPTPGDAISVQQNSCDLHLGADGRVNTSFTIVSNDGIAVLALEKGTGLTCENSPLECLFLIKVPSESLAPVPNTSEYLFTGYAYGITPDCSGSDLGAVLAFTPTPSDWQYLKGSDPSIWWWDSVHKLWTNLPSSVDNDTRNVSANVKYGGTYALFQHAKTDNGITSVISSPPEPEPDDHRLIMIIALILLTGALAIRFAGRYRRDLSDIALLLWMIGTIVVVLGTIFEAFLIMGSEGHHFALLHSFPGIFALILIIAGLVIWNKRWSGKRILTNNHLDWLLITGIVIYSLTILLAFIFP